MRSLRLLGVLLCTLFAINVPAAWATSASATADCNAVTFLYSQWVTVDHPIDVREIISVDGTVVYDDVSSIGKPLGWGPVAFPHAVPYPDGTLAEGSHTIVATAKFTDPSGHAKSQSVTLSTTCEPVCPPKVPNPAGAHTSGDAFGAYVNVSELIKVKKRPYVSSFQEGVGSGGQDDVLATVAIPGLLNLGVLTSSSQASITEDPAEARDVSVAEVADIRLLNGVIKAKVVRASAEAIARGDGSAYSSAGSTFQNLVINGVRYNNVAPNTRVRLPTIPGLIGKGSYVVLHERLTTSSAPPAGTLAGGTYSASIEVNMIHVYLKSPLGLPDPTEITVAHAYAYADFPQVNMCPGDNDGNTVSGHAFTASLAVVPTPDFDLGVIVNGVAIEPTGSTAYVEAASVNLPGPPQLGDVLDAGVAQSYSTGTVSKTSTDSTSYANVADVSLFGGMIKAKAIKSQCASSANADGGASNVDGTVFLGLEVNGQAQGGTPPPNTTIPLGPLGSIILNEQIPDAEAAGHTGVTIRALHVLLPKLGVDVRVAEAHCDAAFAVAAP